MVPRLCSPLVNQSSSTFIIFFTLLPCNGTVDRRGSRFLSHHSDILLGSRKIFSHPCFRRFLLPRTPSPSRSEVVLLSAIAFDFIVFIAFQLNDILLFGAGRTNGRQTLSSVDSVVVTADEPFRDSPKEWFLKRSKKHQNYEDDGDPNFVFHVLDSVIVGTMERLKKLRFGLSILVYYRFRLCNN